MAALATSAVQGTANPYRVKGWAPWIPMRKAFSDFGPGIEVCGYGSPHGPVAQRRRLS